jgi:hypothetical protein
MLNNKKETLLTNVQAAEILSCTPNSLKQSRYDGILFSNPAPSFLKLGSCIRYKPNTIKKWLSQFAEIKAINKIKK